jgi:hypothetical protein
VSGSEHAIVNERKAWARGKLIVAWRMVEALNEDSPGDVIRIAAGDLAAAAAIATEWGIDPDEAYLAAVATS